MRSPHRSLSSRASHKLTARFDPHPCAVTVGINRTGSTGFGQKFCDDIKEDWGGAPFRDIVAGLQFVKDAYPEIDPERMGGCGASYGGFMANWINGHNEQLGLKCLVCHDGVFDTKNTYFTTDELCVDRRAPLASPRPSALTLVRQLLPHARVWRHSVGRARQLRALVAAQLHQALEDAAARHPCVGVYLCGFQVGRRVPTDHLVNTADGSKDYRLLEGEGLSVFNTLQRLGVPSRLLIFPSENHVRLLASPWLTLVVIPALVLTRRCRLSPSRARAVGPPPAKLAQVERGGLPLAR